MNDVYHISFLADGQEVMLPVTPCPFGWGSQQEVVSVEINGTGTVYLPGEPGAWDGDLELMLPARHYPFLSPGAGTEPYAYVNRFCDWCRSGKVIRYIAPGAINSEVLIRSVDYQERDGTGDVYVRLRLSEYKRLEAVATETTRPETGNAPRPETDGGTWPKRYQVKAGDCLSVICRRFYGHSSRAWYNALARYNGIKNPHLIYPGTTLTIPSPKQLGVAA